MKETMTAEVIGAMNANAIDFDPYDVDIFVRLVNSRMSKTVQVIDSEGTVQNRVEHLNNLIRTVLIGAGAFVLLGFSLIGIIATIAHFVCG